MYNTSIVSAGKLVHCLNKNRNICNVIIFRVAFNA